MFPDDTEMALKHALDILNTAWIAVPLDFREPAKLLDVNNPLPHAVALMAKALRRQEGDCKHARVRWNHDQTTGQCQDCNAVFPGPPKHPRGELFNPDSLL